MSKPELDWIGGCRGCRFVDQCFQREGLLPLAWSAHDVAAQSASRRFCPNTRHSRCLFESVLNLVVRPGGGQPAMPLGSSAWQAGKNRARAAARQIAVVCTLRCALRSDVHSSRVRPSCRRPILARPSTTPDLPAKSTARARAFQSIARGSPHRLRRHLLRRCAPILARVLKPTDHDFLNRSAQHMRKPCSQSLRIR